MTSVGNDFRSVYLHWKELFQILPAITKPVSESQMYLSAEIVAATSETEKVKVDRVVGLLSFAEKIDCAPALVDFLRNQEEDIEDLFYYWILDFLVVAYLLKHKSSYLYLSGKELWADKNLAQIFSEKIGKIVYQIATNVEELGTSNFTEQAANFLNEKLFNGLDLKVTHLSTASKKWSGDQFQPPGGSKRGTNLVTPSSFGLTDKEGLQIYYLPKCKYS